MKAPDEEGVAPPPADALAPLAAHLRVLGNEKRLRLLRFLVKPHYLEEIASELKVARQTAQEHVEMLEDAGLVQRTRGRRDHGPVTEFVIVPQRLFGIHEDLGGLVGLSPEMEERERSRLMTEPLAAATRAPREQDLPRLVIVHGMRIGETVPLSGQGPWLLGRDAAADVCLDYDPFVSQRHADVRRSERGGFELADLYSSNGTFVDWQRVPAGERVPLENGSLVRAGRTLVLFRHKGA